MILALLTFLLGILIAPYIQSALANQDRKQLAQRKSRYSKIKKIARV